ncbi:glycosyltransferase family 4 protein [Candidatus Saccharibacteria bacterium]|nr:glycosyltransferase family 4 protein [Candidatus Saccharibacteria bacterium]MBQ6605515.1 glycosyltransferase family 4 protein [Candidatus Saccharibacteria bacterium]
MKILMLGWELPPNNSGGLGVACLNLSKALAKDGADIDFVVPYLADHSNIKFMNVLSATNLDPLFRFGGGAYNSEMISERIIPNITIPDSTPDMMSIRDVQKSYINFIEKYLLEFKPDLVHAHDWLTFEAGVLAKKNFGIPLIAHVHATEYDRSGMNGGNPLVHEIEREGLVLADKIFAVSNATKNLIHEKYQIPSEKIDVVYNSLDENFLKSNYEFRRDSYPYLKKMKEKGYTIVSTVGRFTIQKGLTHFLRAAKLALEKNPKLIFLFAGDGEEKNELVRLAADLGISKNVIFTGFIRGKKLRDIYSISDVFVMSSISEPFGLTALEAAHHGDVLILTKQSGVSEILRSAFFYDFWDEEKLANEILTVAGSESLQKTLKNNIKNEYQRISWDDVAKQCLSVYNKLR